MNSLIELQVLALSRPAVDAPAVTVADWYERKATVLEQLAAQGSAEVAELAATAHRRAIELTEAGGLVRSEGRSEPDG